MLQTKNLTLQAGSRTLHTDLNLSWSCGDFVAILGPNGVGKSTLLSTLAGVQPIPDGYVLLDKLNISKMHPIERASRISSIAQYDEAPPETIVYDRIAHGLHARRTLTRLTRKSESDLVQDIAMKLGIMPLLSTPLFALSGGQRKKVHIARGLVNQDSEVFILDEPDASLDAESRLSVMILLKGLVEQNKLVVVSLHHLELADTFATTQFGFQKQ